jgi:hypothetical protein
MGAVVVGAALLLSACTSSSTHGSTQPSPKPTKSVKLGGFVAGPDPCRLLTSQDIVATLKEPMVTTSRSRSTCTYQNAAATETLTITTAKMTRTGAEQAVLGTGRTVKVKVQHLRGLGNTAIAYLNVAKGLSVATCLFAKNGTFVFLHVNRPHPAHLLQDAVALSRTAASRA